MWKNAASEETKIPGDLRALKWRAQLPQGPQGSHRCKLFPCKVVPESVGIILLLCYMLLHSRSCLFYTFTIFADLLEFQDVMEINTRKSDKQILVTQNLQVLSQLKILKIQCIWASAWKVMKVCWINQSAYSLQWQAPHGPSEVFQARDGSVIYSWG